MLDTRVLQGTMETDASSPQMPKPTEEMETETKMSKDLEQPPLEEELVLHEDEEPDTDSLGTLSNTEVEAICRRLSKLEQKVYRECLQHYRKQMHLYNKMVPTYKEVCSTMKERYPVMMGTSWPKPREDSWWKGA